MSNENNYTIWSFLKKCHERGLIYRGYDAMPWCPRCAVGLSQMEMHEGYQFVAHRSVFVKFPVKRKEVGGRSEEVGGKENLLVWTTTPWTLTSNVAAAVNSQLSYIKVKHKDEIYYLAEGALMIRSAVRGAIQEKGMDRRRSQAQDARTDFQGKRRL